MNWLDLGIVLFVIIFVIIGLKKGFLTQFLDNFTFGTNAFLSLFLCSPIRALFDKIFNITGSIASSYSSKLLALSPDFGTNLLSIEESGLNTFVSETLNKGNFPALTKGLYGFYINNDDLYTKLHESTHTSRSLGDIISSSYGSFFSTIIAFVTSMVILFLLVLLFRFITNKLRTIGLVKFVDNSLGVVYGVFKCFLFFVSICFIIKLLSPLKFMDSIVAYINSSFFGKYIYGTINSLLDNYLNFSNIINSIFKR